MQNYVALLAGGSPAERAHREALLRAVGLVLWPNNMAVDTLKLYNAKRDFAVTNEPAGSVEKAARHGAFFKEIRPATAMVEVSKLIDPDMLIEIEADAVI